MNWFEDYEYPNDHIYAMEREKDIVDSWYKWEAEHKAKSRKPAIIKVIKPKDENSNTSSTIRGAHQERL